MDDINQLTKVSLNHSHTHRLLVIILHILEVDIIHLLELVFLLFRVLTLHITLEMARGDQMVMGIMILYLDLFHWEEFHNPP